MTPAPENDARQVARRRRAEALLSLIERRKPRVIDEFYEIGEALRELRDHKLHAALAFRSFRELLEKRRVMGHSQAHKLVAIVEELSRDQAAGLGQERAYALISYAATQHPTSASQLLTQNTLVGGIPVATASARALQSAAGRARQRAARKAETPAQRAARAALAQVGVDLKNALRASSVGRAAVDVSDDGAVRITLSEPQAKRLLQAIHRGRKAE